MGVCVELQSVLTDKYILAVIEDISNGGASAEDIAKRNHLPFQGVDRAVAHLRVEEIVEGPSDSLSLTEKGRELLKEVRELEHVPSGGVDPKARSRIPDQMKSEDIRQRKENQGG
jgi:predicted methyltransferase